MRTVPDNSTPGPTDRVVPVIPICSVDPVLRETAAAVQLLDRLARSSRAVVLRHDLLADGSGLRRVVSDLSGVVEDVAIEMEHACLSCALREDVVPTVLRLAADGRWDCIVLALPTSTEPLPVLRGLPTEPDPLTRVRVVAGEVVVVTSTTRLLDDVFGDDLLSERGLAIGAEDTRALGEVCCHQLESADLVLLAGSEDPTTSAALRHLCPSWTTIAPLHGRVDGPERAGRVPAAPTALKPAAWWRRDDPRQVAASGAADVAGVWTVVLDSWRPMHPERLRTALQVLTDGRLRARGHIWLPTRPDTVVAWDGAGRQLSIGAVGSWHDRDRSSRLVVTGCNEDSATVRAAFEESLLTDAELAAGLASWAGREDGFDPWLGKNASAA